VVAQVTKFGTAVSNTCINMDHVSCHSSDV